MIIGNV